MKIWDWRRIVEHSNVKPTTKLILLVLSNYMDENGQGAYPNVKTLAINLNLSERSIYRHINEAVASNLIIRKKRHLKGRQWSSNEYEISFPQEIEDMTTVSGDDDINTIERGDTSVIYDKSVRLEVTPVSGDTCHQCQVRGDTSVILPLHSNSSNNSSKYNDQNSENFDRSTKNNFSNNKNKGDDNMTYKLKTLEMDDDMKSHFDIFWIECPKKVAKKATKEIYASTVLTNTATHGELLEGIKRYRKSVENDDSKYIMHPDKWLNQGRWQDVDDSLMSTKELRERSYARAEKWREDEAKKQLESQLAAVS